MVIVIVEFFVQVVCVIAFGLAARLALKFEKYFSVFLLLGSAWTFLLLSLFAPLLNYIYVCIILSDHHHHPLPHHIYSIKFFIGAEGKCYCPNNVTNSIAWVKMHNSKFLQFHKQYMNKWSLE